MHSLFHITPQHLSRIPIWALTFGPFKSFIDRFTMFSECFASLSCCMVHPHFSFNVWIDGFTINHIVLKHPLIRWRIHSGFCGRVSWPCPAAAKAVFGLRQTCCRFLCPNNSILDLSVQSMFQKSFSLSRWSLANFGLALMVFVGFFLQEGFLPYTPCL